MLKILIGDITEHKRDGLLLSVIVTSLTTIIAGIYIIPLFNSNENSIKVFAILLALLNTYISTVVTRISISIFEYCKKRDREAILKGNPSSSSRGMKKLKQEHENDPLKSYEKRYGSVK
ncbi:hypothetical protein [Serratia nevei]|uniref:hypothetical protein n=1 Tax=Serratia nevei TaxID=2703794 RepID=UPI00249AB7D0|nr:hypothetical protein [Serratia nevei]MDI3151388.1 hypothetical protein [Serratia nevei]